jgi:hypothetical protein
VSTAETEKVYILDDTHKPQFAEQSDFIKIMRR